MASVSARTLSSALDTDGANFAFDQEVIEYGAREYQGGEQAGQNAEAQGHGKSLDRAGTEWFD